VVGVGGDEVDRAGFARGVFGDDRFEVVIEGAVGGFVEFLGGNVVGFRWIRRYFEHM